MSHIVAAPSRRQFLQAGTAALPRADTKFDYRVMVYQNFPGALPQQSTASQHGIVMPFSVHVRPDSQHRHESKCPELGPDDRV
jgi:hypothetical protein